MCDIYLYVESSLYKEGDGAAQLPLAARRYRVATARSIPRGSFAIGVCEARTTGPRSKDCVGYAEARGAADGLKKMAAMVNFGGNTTQPKRKIVWKEITQLEPTSKPTH
jgi:hypothetical protein